MYEIKACNNQKWIAENDICDILSIKIRSLRSKCRTGEFVYKIKRINRKSKYFVLIDSLPVTVQKKILGEHPPCSSSYSEAPDWAKGQVEKYMPILRATENMKGKEIRSFIEEWNKNSTVKTSYPSVMKMKQRYAKDGIDGLLPRYGTNSKSTVPDFYFNYFKDLYLKEGAPSLRSCWDMTLGYAIRTDNVKKDEFPSFMSFKRRIESEIPKQSLCLAREGQSTWNRYYSNYIERDYSNIICGKVWVSDHAQIDVACLTDDGKIVFPWVTAWRDYKSGKWLGWILQTGNPNSDLIFQSFYYAAEEYGLPEDVIIDNGKDYRCKDFGGGRQSIRIENNKAKTTTMLAELNVDVHFALPYNAQTKPIERDFLKIKELISKHCVGYRGGNVVERPEKLASEIKNGKIINFNIFKNIFDKFIINVFNKRPSQGKNLKGLSADELFYSEYKEKITPSRDALKLFCMRTSKNFTIGRNGIKDNEVGITYWADWMINEKGSKVYLRRDVQNYKEAWAFKAENNEFAGKVTAVRAVAALHANTVSKEEFKESLSIKKRNLKIAKSYIENTREISLEEQYENYKAAYSSVERTTQPKVSIIANTNMDKAIRKAKEMEEFGQHDLSMFIDDEQPPKEESLYLFETDKILEDELKGAASGY